jgi:hypothetical protein
MKKVLFTNPLGFEFERTDYKKRSKVKVHNNGYNLRTYRFNNVECFESPYISWQNLDQCGGWATDSKYLHTAVHDRKKLLASIVHHNDVHFERRPEVVILTQKYGWLENHSYTYICSKGTLSDFYDLDEVIEHYSRLGIDFTVDEVFEIEEYMDMDIWMFATEKAPFNFHDACTKVQLVVTGLLLGYPLESTASIIEEHGLW